MSGHCVACAVARASQWRSKNLEQARSATQAWKKANPALVASQKQADRKRNREVYAQRTAEWRDRHKNNPEMQERIRAWSRTHTAKRRALQRQAAGDHREAIARIYADCPPGHEVDHRAPLKGRTICGLHVPWNMQYLTIKNNRSKGNKLTEAARPACFD